MTEAWAPTTMTDRMACNGLAVIDAELAKIRVMVANGEAGDTGYDPISLIGPAARGDLKAQRDLAMYGALLVYGAETDQTMTLAEAIMMARLAAAQGDRDDKFRLAMLLALGTTLTWNPTAADEWAAECVARLELLADDADEHAAELLAAFAGTEKPEIIAEAQLIRNRLASLEAS